MVNAQNIHWWQNSWICGESRDLSPKTQESLPMQLLICFGITLASHESIFKDNLNYCQICTLPVKSEAERGLSPNATTLKRAWDRSSIPFTDNQVPSSSGSSTARRLSDPTDEGNMILWTIGYFLPRHNITSPKTCISKLNWFTLLLTIRYREISSYIFFKKLRYFFHDLVFFLSQVYIIHFVVTLRNSCKRRAD
jgi:hypothetical protein